MLRPPVLAISVLAVIASVIVRADDDIVVPPGVPHPPVLSRVYLRDVAGGNKTAVLVTKAFPGSAFKASVYFAGNIDVDASASALEGFEETAQTESRLPFPLPPLEIRRVLSRPFEPSAETTLRKHEIALALEEGARAILLLMVSDTNPHIGWSEQASVVYAFKRRGQVFAGLTPPAGF